MSRVLVWSSPGGGPCTALAAESIPGAGETWLVAGVMIVAITCVAIVYRKLCRSGRRGVRIVLSVKYDGGVYSQMGRVVATFVKRELHIECYNPNLYTKKHCGTECSLPCYGCQAYPFSPLQGCPTDNDCWQTSYRWHLERKFPAETVIMLAIKEDGALGNGQETEKRMAQRMGIRRIEIDASYRIEANIKATLEAAGVV